MKGFIEVLNHHGDERLININNIAYIRHNHDDDEKTYLSVIVMSVIETTFCCDGTSFQDPLAIKCVESYEEIKRLIAEAQ